MIQISKQKILSSMVVTFAIGANLVVFQNCSPGFQATQSSLGSSLSPLDAGILDFKLRDVRTASAEFTNSNTVLADIQSTRPYAQYCVEEISGDVPSPCRAPWQEKVPALLQLSNGDGKKRVALWGKLASGAIAEAPEIASIVVDTTPPALSFSLDGKELATTQVAWVTTPSPRVGITVNDTTSGISRRECKVDNLPFASSCEDSLALSGLSEGIHQVSVKVFDRTENWSQNEIQIGVDRTGPMVALNSPVGSPTTATQITTNLSAVEAGSGVARFECQWNSLAFTPCTTPFLMANLNSGQHVLRVKAYDKVGHVSALEELRWIIDLTSPTITLLSGPMQLTASTSATFTFATEPGNSVTCALDNGPAAPCSSPHALTQIPLGPHSLRITSTKPSLPSSSTLTHLWEVDNRPPSVTSFMRLHANPSNAPLLQFSFTGTQTMPGTPTFECALGLTSLVSSLPPVPCSSGFASTVQESGSYTILLRAVNSLGVRSTFGALTTTVDLSPPVLTLTSPLPTITKSRTMVFSWDATDPESTLTATNCRFNNDVAVSCTSPYTVSSMTEGIQSFSVTAINGAALSQTRTVRWTYDQTPPTVEITLRPPASTTSRSADLGFTITDGVSGVESYQCYLDNVTIAGCSSVQVLNNLSIGNHEFHIDATDRASNSASSVSVAWTVAAPPATSTTTTSTPATTTTTGAPFASIPGLRGAPLPIASSLVISPHLFVLDAYKLLLNRIPSQAELEGQEKNLRTVYPGTEAERRAGFFQGIVQVAGDSPALRHQFVRNLYQFVLGRRPTDITDGEITFRVNQLSSLGAYYEVYLALRQSVEHRTNQKCDSYYTYDQPLSPNAPGLSDFFNGDQAEVSFVAEPFRFVPASVPVGQESIANSFVSGQYNYTQFYANFGARMTIVPYTDYYESNPSLQFKYFTLIRGVKANGLINGIPNWQDLILPYPFYSHDGLYFRPINEGPEMTGLFPATSGYSEGHFFDPHITIDHSTCPATYVVTGECIWDGNSSVCFSKSQTPTIRGSWTRPEVLLKGRNAYPFNFSNPDYIAQYANKTLRAPYDLISASVGLALQDGLNRHLAWTEVNDRRIFPWLNEAEDRHYEGTENSQIRAMTVPGLQSYGDITDPLPAKTALLPVTENPYCQTRYDCNNTDIMDWHREGSEYFILYQGSNAWRYINHRISGTDRYVGPYAPGTPPSSGATFVMSMAKSSAPLGTYTRIADSKVRSGNQPDGSGRVAYPNFNVINGHLYLTGQEIYNDTLTGLHINRMSRFRLKRKGTN